MISTKLNKRENGANLALVCVVGVFVLDLAASQTSAFPSLFNVRAQSIFKRQQQQQQQQQQPVKAQQNQLNPMTSGQQGLSKDDQQQLQFNGAGPLLPGELMRLSSMQQPEQIGTHQLHQAFLGAENSNPHQQRHFMYADGEHEAARSAVPFYRPNVAQQMTANAIMQRQHQQPLVAQDQGATFDLGDHTNYFADVQENSLRPGAKQLGAASSGVHNQLHLEPTHTSEIVDKIEHHIGQQVERTLNHDQHHANQHQQAAASGYQQASEKETTKSEEHEESSASGGSGGESAAADEGGDEKLEKRHEEHHKEPADSHKHHHEEHPPEAFEVHHKKGGKSFQYFHLGHHHHA